MHVYVCVYIYLHLSQFAALCVRNSWLHSKSRAIGTLKGRLHDASVKPFGVRGCSQELRILCYNCWSKYQLASAFFCIPFLVVSSFVIKQLQSWWFHFIFVLFFLVFWKLNKEWKSEMQSQSACVCVYMYGKWFLALK